MISEKSTSLYTESCLLLNGIVVFNPINNELSTKETSIKLAYTESKILSLLIANDNDIISREEMINFSWEGRIVTDASLAKSISNLRKALRNLGLEDDCIITIPRLGYRSTLSAQSVPNPTSVDLHSTDRNQENDSGVGKHDHLSPTGSISTKSNLLSIPIISHIESFKKHIKATSYFVSFILILVSMYNIIWYVDRDINEKFIADGYKEESSVIDGKYYTIIKEDKATLSEGIMSIIALSPAKSTIFVQDKGEVYNICFFTNKIPSSFTFKKSDIEKAKCQIRQFLSKGNTICEL